MNNSAETIMGRFKVFVTPFIRKLSEIMESNEHPEIISWDEKGEVICVHQPELFISKVAFKYYKHQHFLSFARQLNAYGFKKLNRKPPGPKSSSSSFKMQTTFPYPRTSLQILNSELFVTNDGNESSSSSSLKYYHPNFQRGRTELLHQITYMKRGGNKNRSYTNFNIIDFDYQADDRNNTSSIQRSNDSETSILNSESLNVNGNVENDYKQIFDIFDNTVPPSTNVCVRSTRISNSTDNKHTNNLIETNKNDNAEVINTNHLSLSSTNKYNGGDQLKLQMNNYNHKVNQFFFEEEEEEDESNYINKLYYKIHGHDMSRSTSPLNTQQKEVTRSNGNTHINYNYRNSSSIDISVNSTSCNKVG